MPYKQAQSFQFNNCFNQYFRMTTWNYPINFVIAAFIALAIDSHLDTITV